jgi:hypothetical protein
LRHVPRQPREGINVSDTHPLVEAGTLFVGLGAIFVAIVLLLVFLIEVVLYFVPAQKEAALFQDWLPVDLSTVSPADDRLYQTQALVDQLAAYWPGSPYDFRVEIDQSRVANAVSENELAFVLGHELGHFRNRDHLRALGRGITLMMFFAVSTGRDVSGLGITVSDLALRGFSRRQELAADRYGLDVVHARYGHVDEAWRLFERWDAADDMRLDLVTYTSTHPQPEDRIERLEKLASESGWAIEGRVTELDW